VKKLFGTDGIRGIANVYPMTIDMVKQIRRVLVRFSGTQLLLCCVMAEGPSKE